MKNKRFRVDNDDWTNWKEEEFTTAVKAATYIKRNKLQNFTIWIYDGKYYQIIMTRNNTMTTINRGFAIPKVLTDLVRWKGDE